MSLDREIDALRGQPGIHLKTLAEVKKTFSLFKGRRVTVAAGHRHRDRVAQARAVVTPGMTRAEAVRAIGDALNCSRATGYRYFYELFKN